jgi:ABC-type lipoprotein export system ATPase subunit
MVTHDAKAADHASTVLHLEKGVLLERAGVAT